MPRHQVSVQTRFDDPELITLGLQARWIGEQFDDDQNRFRLDDFVTVDLFASRPIGGGLSLFTAVENLFDEDVEIGRTPVRTLGPPRLVRAGVRFERLRR